MQHTEKELKDHLISKGFSAKDLKGLSEEALLSIFDENK